MARITLILTVLTTVIALLGGFKLMMHELRDMRDRKRLTGHWFVLFLFLSCVVAAPTEAATINAASCSLTHVRAAIVAAATGDTVSIPAGSCTWTTTPGIGTTCSLGPRFGTGNPSPGWDDAFCLSATDGDTKSITIQGAGIGQTIITDGIDKTSAGAYPHRLFEWNLQNTGLARITGIEFHGSGTINCGGGRTHLDIHGISSQFRFDHNKTVLVGPCDMIYFSGNVRGVVDHNFFDNSVVGNSVFVAHNSWGNLGNNGDNSWAQPDSWGTAEAMYVEDNIISNDQTAQYYQIAFDGGAGARWVFRYNSFRGGTMYADHGTDTTLRGMRHVEVYNNDWRGLDGVSAWDLKGQQFANGVVPSRSGAALVFNNTILTTNRNNNPGQYVPKVYVTSYFGVPADGRGRTGGFGFCNGTNPWDQNLVATGNIDNAGRRCLDQTGSGHGQLIASNSDTPGCSAWPRNVAQGCIIAWPQQVAQPSYAWNNDCDGTNPCLSSINNVGNTSVITYGTDVIDCPGNTNCRAGYTPYTYPHPLTGQAPVLPPPPVTRFYLRFAELGFLILGLGWKVRTPLLAGCLVLGSLTVSSYQTVKVALPEVTQRTVYLTRAGAAKALALLVKRL